MTRYIQDDSLSDGQIRDKYEKAARDIMDYCKERLSSGYSAHQITEFLKSKYERGKIEWTEAARDGGFSLYSVKSKENV